MLERKERPFVIGRGKQNDVRVSDVIEQIEQRKDRQSRHGQVAFQEILRASRGWLGKEGKLRMSDVRSVEHLYCDNGKGKVWIVGSWGMGQ